MRKQATVAVLIVIGAVTVDGAEFRSSLPADDSPACLAVMPPAVEGVEGSATEVADATRDLFVSILSGPESAVVPLEARLAMHATAEAQQKGCGRVLVARLRRKRSGGGSGGLFGQMLGQAGNSVAWQMPGGGIGGSVVRGVATGGARAVSDLASGTSARDEIRIEYRLVSIDGRTVLEPREERAKASVDGEDLLTPLVQRIAEAIAPFVLERQQAKEIR